MKGTKKINNYIKTSEVVFVLLSTSFFCLTHADSTIIDTQEAIGYLKENYPVNLEYNKAESNLNNSYGDSNFGNWITDEFGLPAFEYKCDQKTELRAIYETPTGPKTLHWHQIGNDKLIAIGTNDGYVQLFSGEKGPKWINDYNPLEKDYSGGFGYINDGNKCWSTLYLDKPDDAKYQRVFGMGYYKKSIDYNGINITQYIFAPFGNDSILISQVSISNSNKESKNLKYFEYWDVNTNEIIPSNFFINTIKLKLNQRLTENYNRITYDTYFDKKLSSIISKPNLIVKGINTNVPSRVDKNPSEIFLTCFNHPISGFEGDQNVFFGNNYRDRPESVINGRTRNSTISENKLLGKFGATMVLESEINLSPDETKTIYYGYGYADIGKTDELISKYKDNIQNILNETMDNWKQTIPIFNFTEDNWFSREMAWDYYYLRSGSSYDNYFKCHTICQGGIYLYIVGVNTGLRDSCMDALPMIFLYPELAKEVLRYTMRASLLLPKGEIPYGISNYGIKRFGLWLPSDSDLYFLLLATEYILYTRDFKFLDEMVSYYSLKNIVKESVYEHLKVAYNHLINVVGIGKHGLIKMRTGDWNDMIVYWSPTNKLMFTLFGESTLNTAFAAYVLPNLAYIAELKGDTEFALTIRNQVNQLKGALKNQWTGKWFNRAHCGDIKDTILGDADLFLEPQSWALISKIVTDEQADILIKNIYSILNLNSSIGAVGFSSNANLLDGWDGGIWPALNGPLIWGTSLYNKNLAWTQMKNITFAKHAEEYPDIWYGVWSGADMYLSNQFGNSGKTSPVLSAFYPVQNMNSHAWPLYSSFKLLGVEANKEGIVIDPKYPFEEFSAKFGNIGINYTNELISGFYKALGNDTIDIKIKIPIDFIRGRLVLKINDNVTDYKLEDDFLSFTINIFRNDLISWKIFNES